MMGKERVIATEGMRGSMKLKHSIIVPLLMGLFSLISPCPVSAYEVIRVVDGGTIRGSVRWLDAIIPERPLHAVVKNRDFCGKTFVDDALMINPENMGMQDVVVFLANIEKGKAPLARYVGIVEGCRFKPRVIPVVKGKLIGFRHNDFILHSIHAFRTDNNATIFNVGLPIHRWQQVVAQKMRRTGLFRLQCDIHAHMNGLIISLEHDYFAVTDSAGDFEIKDIPPGKYEVVAFQAGYQIQNWEAAEEGGSRPVYVAPLKIIKEVEVTANGVMRVNFGFGAKK